MRGRGQGWKKKGLSNTLGGPFETGGYPDITGADRALDPRIANSPPPKKNYSTYLNLFSTFI